MSKVAKVNPFARAGDRADDTQTLVRQRPLAIQAAVTVAAFLLFCLSAYVLELHNATLHFGADQHLYELLATGVVLDRITRFHPVTVVLALGWIKVFGPMAAGWLAPQFVLKAGFAAVGAVGVWAAISAFSAFVPAGFAALCGVIYATSFGVWYFSSIEESKIVTATLSAIYIALYINMRHCPRRNQVAVLSLCLFVACLNEIVSGFLIVIPLVDTLYRQGWKRLQLRWLVVHAMAGPVALAVLEVANGRLIPAATDSEAPSHFGMLLFYVLKSDHGWAALQAFASHWLFFNIAAPTSNAPYWAEYGGYFTPSLAGYAASPAAIGTVAVLAVMLSALVVRSFRPVLRSDVAAILCALAAYSLVRGAFFFVFNPAEPLLFTPAVTLAHLLVLMIAFHASKFPAKTTLVLIFAMLLSLNNGIFIFTTWRDPGAAPALEITPVPFDPLGQL